MSRLGIYDETSGEIFFEDDLVFITIKPHPIKVTSPTTYAGRISHIPKNEGIVLDISQPYNGKMIELDYKQIIKIEKLNLVGGNQNVKS